MSVAPRVPKGELPFWMSPWRLTQRQLDGDGPKVVFAVATVAHSRSQRHSGVEIAIPDGMLSSLPPREGKTLVADLIVGALKQLGIVPPDGDRRAHRAEPAP